MTWSVGVTPLDLFAVYDDDGNPVCTFDNGTGEAEPNKSRAELVAELVNRWAADTDRPVELLEKVRVRRT